MNKQYRSDAFAAIHETACDLHDAGAMDIRTLRKFDKMCLTPVQPSGGDKGTQHRDIDIAHRILSEWRKQNG